MSNMRCAESTNGAEPPAAQAVEAHIRSRSTPFRCLVPLVAPHQLGGKGIEQLDKERSRICRKALHYIRRFNPPQVPALLMPLITAQNQAPEAVIDTNVVLDWLLFEDPWGLSIGSDVLAGRLRWVGTQPMLDELASVLSRPGLERWTDRIDITWAMATEHCRLVAPRALPTPSILHCSDPDDQKFIDLAIDRRVQCLFSRDKALLRLARRAKLHGVSVLRPDKRTASAPERTLPSR